MRTETEELLLKKMDELMQKFNDQEERFDERFKEYEESSTKLFATLLLQFSSDVAEDFKKLLDKTSSESVSNEEIKESIIHLQETVNSKAVEQAVDLFSDKQLTQLRLDVVKPVTEQTDRILKSISDNTREHYDGTLENLQTLHDSVVSKLREVENNLMSEHKTTQSRVEAIKGQRRFN